MSPRLKALRARHAELEAALEEELRRPQPSLATVRAIKRRKLALKDEMASLNRDLESA